MPDELLDRLRAVRPETPTGLLEPDTHLLEEILMETKTNKTPRRLLVAAAAAAAAVGIAVTLPDATPMKAAGPSTTAPVVLDMKAIATSTAAALRSGRAHVRYTSDNGHYIHDAGSFVIEFNGEDTSTVGTLDPGNPCEDASVTVPQERCEAQPFEVANKIVDGRFYLRDGAPGQQTWIEDTNEHVTGSDFFSVDPRSIVTGEAQAAGFVDTGADTVDGVATRHLQATKLDAVPGVNLGLGPILDDTTKVTKFEVWVDKDNVVRRLDIDTSRTETIYPLARTVISKDADGTVHKTLDESNMGPSEQRTLVNKYTVTFTDIGAPITIEAPVNARKIAGKG